MHRIANIMSIKFPVIVEHANVTYIPNMENRIYRADISIVNAMLDVCGVCVKLRYRTTLFSIIKMEIEWVDGAIWGVNLH